MKMRSKSGLEGKFFVLSITLGLLLSLVLIAPVVLGEEGLSGNDILVKVDAKQETMMAGDMVRVTEFEITHPDGTTTTKVFGSLSKVDPQGTDKTLIYVMKPDNERGIINLIVNPEEEQSRFWYYAPGVGQAVEFPGQGKSFGESGVSYSEVGGQQLGGKFDAELVGEETVEVGGESIPCYVLELTAKEDAEVLYPSSKTWIAKDMWLTIKSQDFNEEGELARKTEVLKLVRLGGIAMSQKLNIEDVLNESTTVISFLERRMLEKPITEEVFDPQKLGEFDPSKWGFDEYIDSTEES